MPNTPKMIWPYPSKDQDPWYDSFVSLVTALDASGYAAREDRDIVLTGGGNVAFTASSGVLTWAAAIDMMSPISGFKMSLGAGSATLADGQALYVNVTRAPTGNVSLSSLVAGQLPNTDNAMMLAIRYGTSVYWRNGARISDGDNRPLFAGSITFPPSGIYGNGQDGPVHFDGTTTVTLPDGTTIVPSAGVYPLPRDLWSTTCIIDVAATVTGPWRVVGNVSLTLNGIIHRNGHAGTVGGGGAGVGGAALAAGSLPASTKGGDGPGGNPQSGGTYVPNRYTGTPGLGATGGGFTAGTSATGYGCGGGGGYVTGAAAGFDGGSAGTTLSSSGPDLALAQWAMDLHVPGFDNSGALTLAIISPGGGGGAGWGGGGGSAGLVLVAFPIITGTGSIQSIGGAGGNSTIPTAGGGGGGGGGIVIIITTGALPTCTLTGGAGGIVTGGGYGGGAGAPGLVLSYSA